MALVSASEEPAEWESGNVEGYREEVVKLELFALQRRRPPAALAGL